MEHNNTNAPSRSSYVNKKCRCEECSQANKEFGQQYTKGHREQIRAVRRVYVASNREKLNALMRAWAKRNPEKEKARHRAYRENNREKVLLSARLASRKAILNGSAAKAQKRYAQTEKGRITRMVGFAAYRARKSQADGTTSATQYIARWAFYGGKCYLCGKTATVFDHVIPLSKGGSNWPANLRPACRSCNSRKRNRSLVEYYQYREATP